MTKLDYLKEKIEKINGSLKGNYLNKISELSSSDYLFSFSKSKSDKLLISLSSQLPFFDTIDIKTKDSLSSLFLQSLKNKLLNSCFLNASLYNEDSIIDFKFLKTTDTYDHIEYHLLFEVFKGNTNLILLNKDKIELAFRYHSLDTSHPLIQGTIYIPPKKIEITREIDVDNELNKEKIYIENLNNKYLKEKYNSLILQLKRKLKSLKQKEINLNNEINKAKENLNYKEYADYYLTIMEKIKKGDSYFIYNDKKIPLKTNYSITDNLTHLYKIYKKAKNSIELTNKFLNETKDDIEYIENILSSKEIYNDSDYLELINELKKKNLIKIKVKINKDNKNQIASRPYYIEVLNHKIGYGKNSSQNDYLTFKLARKDDLYLHLANEHSSHIIIFKNDDEKDISDELVKIGSSLLLYISSKSDATIYIANKKDVKKGSSLGQANLLKYETIFFKEDNSVNIKELINESKRFI